MNKDMNDRLSVCGLILTVAISAGASQIHKGFPSQDGVADLKKEFQSPPKGYGTVPFYWWDGDSLNRDRLADQLRILGDAAVDGFSVSYIHSHPQIDADLNASGYGGFGKPDPGKPGVFSDGWWDIWNWFAGECADRGVGLGLDDYVVGWEKNGYYVDGFKNYQGRLELRKYDLNPDSVVDLRFDKKPVSVAVYPSGVNLTDSVSGDLLTYKCPAGAKQTLYVVTTTASHELHPEYGKRLIDVYFGRFEDKLDARARESLNYFFQDELHYNLNIHSWAEDMPDEFKKRKGYDITPYLASLFENVDAMTPKVRLDYADVLTQLSEERYFKPVFDWHNDRGLIYGCDNNGRGLEPLQYLDYFRMTSWFTAPGNDAPARGSSFRQTKVSSSISHLYKRPRTWLEAFHSMGWNSNGEWLTSQLDHHIIAGGNLLCLHGLYYSTHGGWWEWAPPCFHFRMPYWPHMKKWLEYGERLSYLLSQGEHVCDIAVLYPTESMQAYRDANPDNMWAVTDRLSERGLDYDYVDYHSLKDAVVDSGRLVIAGESYKAIVLPDVKAMHFSTLQKIDEFQRAGGIVVSTGKSLRATSHAGENDAVMDSIWNGIFSPGHGNGHIVETGRVADMLSEVLVPDFKPAAGKGNVLHRRIGDHDVYMVMGVEKGSEMFFRAKGLAEVWNAKDGSSAVKPILRQDDNGTWLEFDGDTGTSALYVFSPGEPVYDSGRADTWKLASATALDGDWDVEIIPTLDNKWGDFRLPASDGLIGPEAREFSYRYLGKSASPALSADKVYTGIYGFAPAMEMAVFDKSENLESCLSRLDEAEWSPYTFSWQYGVKDSPGSQGYHGLKGKLDNRFIILDKGGHQIFRTNVYAPSKGIYVIENEGVRPDRISVDGKDVDGMTVALSKGWHRVVIAYADTPESEYNLADKKSYCWDDRKRGAVVFYPESHGELKDNDPYGKIIASKWYGSDHLQYSVVGKPGLWEYTFGTAPGAESLTFNVAGEIKNVWVNGVAVGKKSLRRIDRNSYELSVDPADGHAHEVRLTAVPEAGCEGAAFFVEPVSIKCGAGKLPAGNWSDTGALKYFSGGIRYKKGLNLSGVSGNRYELDLGMVDATCEVSVNGRQVDILMSTPYRLDITDYVREGDNMVEVLVYSTLSNHYQTVPSAYRGEPRAGLIGPVSVKTMVKN